MRSVQPAGAQNASTALVAIPGGGQLVASDGDSQQSSNYRIMFSLYRRFTPADGTPGTPGTSSAPLPPLAPTDPTQVSTSYIYIYIDRPHLGEHLPA